MYRSDGLEVWNLTPGAPAASSAQEIFNVVGHIDAYDTTAALRYRLNDGPERPVYFKRDPEETGRLARPGDFNIDTIRLDDLRPENVLRLCVQDQSGDEHRHTLAFTAHSAGADVPHFRLEAASLAHVEEAGQVIDGRWRLGRDAEGACLEIREEDAGYDRLIAFGRHDWTTGYTVKARLRVTAWTNVRYQNVGLIFKWNPHRQGDGHHLPWEWSTGLGYYAAHCPGLRLRFGVDVHRNGAGKKIGCHVLQEKPYVRWRRWAGFLKNEALRLGRRPLTQLRPDVPYHFRLLVHPARYALTVWEAGRPEPAPQLDVPDPPELLPGGSVGLIAAHCALRVYDYDVNPV